MLEKGHFLGGLTRIFNKSSPVERSKAFKGTCSVGLGGKKGPSG